MAAYIRITESGLEDALDRFRNLGQEGRERVLTVVGLTVTEQTIRRIREEKTGPDGRPWPPLNPEYQKSRRAGGMLVDSGRLMGSIHYQLAGDRVEIGSGVVYAAIHQFGGTITPKAASRLVFHLGGRAVFAKSVTIPARPYLGVSDDNASEVEQRLVTLFGDLMQ